jgi:hypothetical protein
MAALKRSLAQEPSAPEHDIRRHPLRKMIEKGLEELRWPVYRSVAELTRNRRSAPEDRAAAASGEGDRID